MGKKNEKPEPLEAEDQTVIIPNFEGEIEHPQSNAAVCDSQWLKWFRKQNWSALYEEFCTARNKYNQLKYKTSWLFCRKKFGEHTKEAKVAWEAIGPRPQGNLRVPWLGNWQQVRQDLYSTVTDPKKILLLKQTIKERNDHIEASRATLPVLKSFIVEFERLKEKLVEAFGGEPFREDLKPDDPKNMARFKLYADTMFDLWKKQQSVVQQWLEIFKVDSKTLAASGIALQQNFGTGAPAPTVVGPDGQPYTLGAVTPTGQTLYLPAGVTPEHVALAQMEVLKAQQYDLDMTTQFKEVKKEANEDKPKTKPH